MGWLVRLMWFTKFRKLGRANALGLLLGACAWIYVTNNQDVPFFFSLLSEQFANNICAFIDGCLDLSPVSKIEILACAASVVAAVSATKLFNVLSPYCPVLLKVEGKAEELLGLVPEIDPSYPSKNKTVSEGPANGNYNKPEKKVTLWMKEITKL